MKGEHLLAEFMTTPWALHPEVLSSHAGVLARWVNGGASPFASGDGPAAGRDRGKSTPPSSAVSGNIAVVPVLGTLMQRANLMQQYCGGTSCNQVAAALKQADADDAVQQILMEFDTPGGSVYGVAELAAVIRAMKKPVIGIANSQCASAGYWLAAQCAELYVAPGGEVGSIGVWQAHEDWSKALEKAGVQTTLIAAGKYKVEGNPYEALSRDAKAFLQSRVDAYYAAFTKDVARGRAVPVGMAQNGMGQGRVLGADQALSESMVDGIATREQVLQRMAARKPSGSRLAQARAYLQ
jgi:capsid assembly protease